ncbi:helix-turn-helix domain-containing protein [Plantactinospora solaniradicis]|uniref:Helix-turn-helix domain-containing protein n=1 Tax=Plantactinospora solaniradicis TaxID=1723736 RepID=A0ABW1K2W9_9ACTN
MSEPDLTRLRTAVAAIEESRGQLEVAELAVRIGVGYRALYRLFAGRLGLSPKRFGEIVRYYHFVGGLLGGGPGNSAALLASPHGYYDQAHAARDFKRFTGVSAGTFRRIEHGIAQLMHTEPPPLR